MWSQGARFSLSVACNKTSVFFSSVFSSSKSTWCQEYSTTLHGFPDTLVVFFWFSTWADGLRKSVPLSFEGNVVLNWKNFVQDVELFIAAAHGDKNEETKVYIFLNLSGREAIEKEKSFVYVPAALNLDSSIRVPAESHESIAILKRKFAEICDPCGNVIMERHKFNTRTQKQGEPFQSFVLS